MSVSSVSTSAQQLVPGSATLTRAQARERGYRFYQSKNQMTGETTDGYSAPLTGISCSLTNVHQVQLLAGADGKREETTVHLPGAEKFGLYRPDAAGKYAAEDTGAVESKLSEMLGKAGIDTQAPISLTQQNADGSRLLVGKDNPQWQRIQDLLDNTPALANDIRRVWNEQVMSAKVRVAEDVNGKIDASVPAPADTSWHEVGSRELAQIDSRSREITFQDGNFDFSKIAGTADG